MTAPVQWELPAVRPGGVGQQADLAVVGVRMRLHAVHEPGCERGLCGAHDPLHSHVPHSQDRWGQVQGSTAYGPHRVSVCERCV